MTLKQTIGDDKTYALPMTWDGAAHTVAEGEVLVFSAKYDKDDEDEESVFQKALGAGITVDGSTATLTVLREDTVNEPASITLQADLRATRLDGSSRKVWEGLLRLERGVTRNTTTSRAVITSNEPLPVILPGWEVIQLTLAAYEALTTEEQEDETKIYAILDTI